MNISYNWLKDLIEINSSPQELAEELTRVGLAVEGIHAFEGDFVFDIDLTSNRPDCLSHIGIAREVRTVTNSQFTVSEDEHIDSGTGISQLVTLEDPELCRRFTARIIRNVKIAPSPEWLKQRLEALGERSINNVADITNYVMLELGNPMHAFDLQKLKENRIVVRRARQGETIKTLDEVERELDDAMLVICDAEKPVAVAGIMGGFESSITEETTDVLIEVAYFARSSIRQTSRKLNLATEASYRFERGVDIENLIRASNRAAELICELAGGELGEFVDVYPTPYRAGEIVSNDLQASVNRLTGLTIPSEEIEQILKALGIERKNTSIYLSPSWRYDLTIEEDLVEEVVRIYGYEKIAEELPPAYGAGEYQPNELRKFHLRQTLANMGFDEAISYSFIDTKNDERFEIVPDFAGEQLDEKFISLRDSIVEGSTRMRPSLLSGLLDAVRTNFNHQQKNLRLFEIGKAFAAAGQENELPVERELFALTLTGSETFQGKAMAVREFDFYDAKGMLESAIDAVNTLPLEFAPKDVKHLRRGQSAEILIDGKPIGTIGRVSDEVAQSYKFKQPVFVAEVDLQTLLGAGERNISYQPLSVYPAIQRDVSLIIDRNINFTEIRNAIFDQKAELLRKVEFVDIYEGQGVNDNERSITIRLQYRSPERTLLEEEVDQIHSRILLHLDENLGAKQRF